MKKMSILSILMLTTFMNASSVLAQEYDNINASAIASCGDGLMNNIPGLIPKVIKIAYTIIQIAVPVVLVIMGTLDLAKGVIAQKEEEIKKGQQLFVKRLIAGAIVFFSFVVVKFVISFVADENSNRILDCADCFISNNCDK